jgi:polysaccharide export outer membrane protein
MSNKMLILAAIIVMVAMGTSTTRAQEQAQGPVSSSNGGVDSQGIRNYLLGPGDVLDVRVFGQSDLSSTVEIDSDGNISSLPFLETPIRAQCRTEKEVQKDIAKAYAKYIKNPQVSVLVKDRKSRQPSTITGAVRTPMQVFMMREVRLHELLTKAGGWTDRASGTIEIMHTQAPMCAPDGVFQNHTLAEKGNFGMALFKISDLKAGKEEADPVIWPGDVVTVREGDPVYVTGMVVKPTELIIRDKLTLTHAIAMAGGPLRMAKTNELHVLRQKEGGTQEDLKFNFDAIRKGKDPDVELKPFDIVAIDEASLFSKKGWGDLMKGIVKSGAGMVTTRGFIY